MTLVCERESDGPEGEELAEKLTVPENPFTEASVIVDADVEPGLAESDDGFEEIVKSGVCKIEVKNSLIGLALASPEAKLAKFQLASIVFGNE